MTTIDIPNKLCPICSKNKTRKQGVSLIGHIIPNGALEKFINSKESMFENDNTVKRYQRSLSPKTRRIATASLMRFCWAVHLTPSEIIGLNPKKLRQLLDDFESYILEAYENPTLNLEKYLTKYQALAIGRCLKGFIKTNAVGLSELEYKAIFKKLFDLSIPKQKDFVPTKTDIRKVYSYATERDKLLIHFLTNCSLRREEFLGFLTWKKLGDLSKSYPKIDFFDTELKGSGTGKYKGCHFTMIICESLRKALIEWKEKERKRFRDNLVPISEEDFEKLPVFLSSDCIDTPEGKKILPLEYGAVGDAFYDLQRKTKIPLSCHSFRYYVQGITQKVLGVDSPWNYFFLGHKLPQIQAVYSKIWQDYNEVLKAFKKVEAYLDLFYDETKIEDQLKLRAIELQKEGKDITEIVDTIMRERTRMLIQDLGNLKGSMIADIKEAEKQYKRKTEE